MINIKDITIEMEGTAPLLMVELQAIFDNIKKLQDGDFFKKAFENKEVMEIMLSDKSPEEKIDNIKHFAVAYALARRGLDSLDEISKNELSEITIKTLKAMRGE